MNRRNAVASLIALVLSSAVAVAGTVSYPLYVDTSGIAALAPGGGWIDFQFNQVNSLSSPPATATIDHFTSAGFLFGSPALLTTGVTGALPGPVVIPNDQGGMNAFTQPVDAWGSFFQFQLTLDQSAAGPQWTDGSDFYVFLLLPDFNPIVAPLDIGEVLDVSIDANGGTTVHGSAYGAEVPEPAAALLCLSGLAVAALRWRKRIR